jgi:hypothetical protein
MRRTGLLVLVFGAAMTLSAESALARCGAFDLLEGDNFCVKCPSARAEKVYMCPGGPAGMAVAVAAHPNCSVTSYGPGCGDHGTKRKKPQ